MLDKHDVSHFEFFHPDCISVVFSNERAFKNAALKLICQIYANEIFPFLQAKWFVTWIHVLSYKSR